MLRLMPISATLALCLAAFGPASAQNVMPDDPQKMVEIIQDMGYRAKLTRDNTGDPKIESTAGGSNFSIYFYGCQNNANCTTIQFVKGYDLDSGMTYEAINEWNRDFRFGRAYLDSEFDPYLEMDVNMDFGGVPLANFEDNFAVWESLLQSFEDHIDW